MLSVVADSTLAYSYKIGRGMIILAVVQANAHVNDLTCQLTSATVYQETTIVTYISGPSLYNTPLVHAAVPFAATPHPCWSMLAEKHLVYLHSLFAVDACSLQEQKRTSTLIFSCELW